MKSTSKQIAELKELWAEQGWGDLSYLDRLPKPTVKDEPIPFPYGRPNSEREDFGQWLSPSERAKLVKRG